MSPATIAGLTPEFDLHAEIQRLAIRLGTDAGLREQFLRELTGGSGRITSALLATGSSFDYLGLEVVALVHDDDHRRDMLTEVVLSPSVLLPLDLRAAALELLLPLLDDAKVLVTRWKQLVGSPDTDRHLDLLRRDSDGVDHVYDVPVDQNEFVALLTRASETFQADRVDRLLQRVIGNPTSTSREVSPELDAVITANLRAQLLEPTDFIVSWDQVVGTDASGGPLTIAEIAKALLVHPLAKLPGRALRRAAVGFYRTVFGVGGRSIVGLGAGFLYVEHGLTAEPSYVFVGQDAIIGKGVTLDTVGGVVLGRESFVGGGFLPILIHTHKHLRDESDTAASERRRISRTAFVAENGARFPMSEIGLFECADYLDRPEPFPGIRVISIQES